jgi:hypothetical protein
MPITAGSAIAHLLRLRGHFFPPNAMLQTSDNAENATCDFLEFCLNANGDPDPKNLSRTVFSSIFGLSLKLKISSLKLSYGVS